MHLDKLSCFQIITIMTIQPSLTVCELLSKNSFYVPSYQRAYSWETKKKNEEFNFPQVNTFFNDLTDYVHSRGHLPYFFGHLLFGVKEVKGYPIIDGQQRLTTIILFLAAISLRLQESSSLSEPVKKTLNQILNPVACRFTTVEYDQAFLRKCLLTKKKFVETQFKTQSQRRMAAAYNFFLKKLKQIPDKEANKYLEAVLSSVCTTHTMQNEAEAIQLFIFQNNRGKHPTNLELIRAEFLHYVFLNAPNDNKKTMLIASIQDSFETIFENIVKIDDKIKEDDILLITQRIFWRSLYETSPLHRVQNELRSKQTKLDFINNFLDTLTNCFNQISYFFEKEKKDINFHSFYLSGNLSTFFPIVIQALIKNTRPDEFIRLIRELEELSIRHRLVRTRADLAARLNPTFQEFNGPEVDSFFERIKYMRETEHNWWSHWNSANVKREATKDISPDLAKFLLWKYENHLLNGKPNGYEALRYDDIENPQLEHIAPQTKRSEKHASGYCHYDEDFLHNYLNTLGNYLLISGRHNKIIGNKPFKEKRASYSFLKQQEEIQEETTSSTVWGKHRIKKRTNKILDFVFKYYNC